jgi:hypothetical protein
VVRETGRPTCNAKWKEIIDALPNGLKAHECPDIVARVFNIKLKSFLDDVLKKNVLGKVKAYTYVIEFQKRGLPHAHILLIMKESDRPKSADQYDVAVTAELAEDPEIREVQAEFMIHQCGPHCIEEGEVCCKKGFPKPFNEHTTDGNNSYPNYRRRSPEDGGHTTSKRGKGIDNRRVVPHNLYLLMKYRCHLNVEVCHSIACVKYLYKYVYKGHDRVMYGIKEKANLTWIRIIQVSNRRQEEMKSETLWKLAIAAHLKHVGTHLNSRWGTCTQLFEDYRFTCPTNKLFCLHPTENKQNEHYRQLW